MRGTAAEQYVAAQALRRGFRVALPLVDQNGADLYILSSRNELVSVQVKTAKKHRQAWRLKLREYTVDVYAAVTPNFEKTWIVPAVVLAGLHHNAALRDKWLDRWDVFEAVGAFRGRAA